jgi:hypothetical protein
MNESIRTVVFVAVAAVVALAAYASRPKLEDPGSGGLPTGIGNPLFPDFKDPLLARSLEIKQFDEDTAQVSSFEVTQQPNGLWTIPSHGNYPADAESQLKAVAETLADLKIIAVQTDETTIDKQKEHELYGVIDPNKVEVGTKGVGTLITMQDGKLNDLLSLIVGKPATDGGGSANLRFVRKPTEDVVYVTTIDLNKLPTEFDKWIEKDLLKLSTFDVSRVHVKDYLVLRTRSGSYGLVQRLDADLSYDSSKAEWKVEDLVTFRGQERVQSPLGELEELNKPKLDDLRNGLGDLKIVDVRRKPEGLGKSLQVSADQLPPDQQQALAEMGFFPSPTSDGKLEIYGANGELVVDTKDGVQYVLRFGNIAPEISPTKKPDTDAAKKDDKAAEDEVKVHRYLFVTTRLAPSVLTPPELEPEPAGPEPAEGQKKDEEAAKAEGKDEQKKSDEAATVDPQQAERERIKKENERKLNAYRDQKKKAETRVSELNARFADWYYVVAEDVYKKIHLVRSDIVKEKATAKDEGFGPDAFRKLEEEGLKKATAMP